MDPPRGEGVYPTAAVKLSKGYNMTIRAWKQLINKSMREAGTYNPDIYGASVETLAAILARRDYAQAEWERDGRKLLVEHTNKAGASYMEKHPLLKQIDAANDTALIYWRELGLTPKGFKALTAAAITQANGASLSELISDISNA